MFPNASSRISWMLIDRHEQSFSPIAWSTYVARTFTAAQAISKQLYGLVLTFGGGVDNGRLADIDSARFEDILRFNLTGPFLCCFEAVDLAVGCPARSSVSAGISTAMTALSGSIRKGTGVTEMLEYAPKGLIGVLTPQANTTVEPEFSILCPPGYGLVTARLTSDKSSMDDRLIDYVLSLEKTVDRFANMPLGVMLFACTGASYLVEPEEERAIIAGIEAKRSLKLITAAECRRRRS